MTDRKTYTTQEISPRVLMDTPEFYRSVGNNPSTGRMAGRLNVKDNLYPVTEFFETTNNLGSFDVFFTNAYKTIPLVLGIKRMRNGKYSTLVQQDPLVAVLTDRITILGSLLDEEEEIVYIKGRVISLDVGR